MKNTIEKWGLAVWTIQILCAEGKVEGAAKFRYIWMIPADTVKPTYGRVTAGEYKNGSKN